MFLDGSSGREMAEREWCSEMVRDAVSVGEMRGFGWKV